MLREHPSESPLAEVVNAFGYTLRSQHRLGGGQSGVRVWRLEVEDRAGQVASLVAKQSGQTRWHPLIKRAGGCDAVRVAVPLATPDGGTVVQDASGAAWQLEPLLPGEAVLCTRPDLLPQVGEALLALQTHLNDDQVGRSPTIAERLRVAERFVADARVRDIRRELAAHVDRTLPLQWVWKDLWHAHVLIAPGERPGLIDAAAATIDHPAVDFGRLLGSLPRSDRQWLAGLPIDRDLVDLFERSGVLLSWHRWQVRGDHPLKSERLRQLSDRLQDLFP